LDWEAQVINLSSAFFNGFQLTFFTALLAKDVLIEIISPGLPSNQWILEVTRWFTTSLAKIQSSIIEYASNDQDLGPYGYVDVPDTFLDQPPAVRTAFQAQCETQRIHSSGEVQSFSVLGMGIVLGTTVILVFISLVLDSCMKITRRWRRSVSPRAVARQADDKLHLLRMTLGDQSEIGMDWTNGSFDVPVTGLNVEIERPSMGSDGLVSYPYEMKDQIRDNHSMIYS
jgi:hypothetical protein